jgi:hypothetical protein
VSEALYQPGHAPLKFCGVTKAGVVRFCAEGAALLANGGRLTVTDAEKLGRELLAASSLAKEFIAQSRGEHLWDVISTDGAVATVKHRGSVARMCPVMNGKRRHGRTWKCTACNRDVPTGEKMYVCEGAPPFRWGRPRMCFACLVPLDPISRIEAIAHLVAP